MRKPAAALMAGLLALASASGMAADDPEAIVDARQAAMKGMERDLDAISEMLAGLFPYRPDEALAYASKVDRAVKGIPGMFPPGSRTPGSEALPKVWDDRETFEERAERVQKRVGGLLAAVKADDRERVADWLRRINKACAGCHTGFRKGG